MSLLIFVHQPQQVLIITDTLATTHHGDPFLFTAKCWPVPQMKLIVTGTGLAPLHEAWYRRLQTSLLARDIAMLDKHAPEALRGLWAELQAEHGELPGTATVYHFGVPEGGSDFVRYAYRSEKDFASERTTEPGMGVKPVPSFALEVPDSLDGFIELASRIRAEQDRLPKPEGIHIGGDLVLTVLQPGTVSTSTMHRFSDYDDMWQAMNERQRK